MAGSLGDVAYESFVHEGLPRGKLERGERRWRKGATRGPSARLATRRRLRRALARGLLLLADRLGARAVRRTVRGRCADALRGRLLLRRALARLRDGLFRSG